MKKHFCFQLQLSAKKKTKKKQKKELITESGVHQSLHPNSHQQIIFAEFNLEINYPPPYFRKVWHYQDANTDLIRRAIDMFD